MQPHQPAVEVHRAREAAAVVHRAAGHCLPKLIRVAEHATLGAREGAARHARALHFVHGPMQLDDHLAARRLVQPVDVLRDDAREDARCLQVGQRPVRRASAGAPPKSSSITVSCVKIQDTTWRRRECTRVFDSQ